MPCKHSRRQAHRFYSHAHSSCHQNRRTGNCKCYLSELGKVQLHHAPTCLFLQGDWTDGCKTMVRTGGLGNRRIYISVCRKNRDSIPFRTQADSPTFYLFHYTIVWQTRRSDLGTDLEKWQLFLPNYKWQQGQGPRFLGGYYLWRCTICHFCRESLSTGNFPFLILESCRSMQWYLLSP